MPDSNRLPAGPSGHRPKRSVETLARTMERLRVYNYEFVDAVELINIIDELCFDLNNEISQATSKIPLIKWKYDEKSTSTPISITC